MPEPANMRAILQNTIMLKISTKQKRAELNSIHFLHSSRNTSQSEQPCMNMKSNTFNSALATTWSGLGITLKVTIKALPIIHKHLLSNRLIKVTECSYETGLPRGFSPFMHHWTLGFSP